MSAPYISVVVGARNDDHGGNMIGRMQAFLDSWCVQAERLGLPSEIVVVEWNPPGQRPCLREALDWPSSGGLCEGRIFEVPHRIHQALPHAKAIALHQMIAKNAGIRRSRGEFVLATNLDIVFSPALMQFLAGKRLEPGALYRMDRYDVAAAIPPHAAGVDALLHHCASNVLRVFAAEGNLAWRDGEALWPVEAGDIAPQGVQFGRGWRPLESQGERRHRWLESAGKLHYRRPAGMALELTAEVGPSQGGGPLPIEVLDASGAVLAAADTVGRCHLRLLFPDAEQLGAFVLRVRGRAIPLDPEIRLLHLRVEEMRWEAVAASGDGWRLQVLERSPGVRWEETLQAPSPDAAAIRNPADLHVNASGDFTLLSRRDWFRLRACAEFPIWPLHLDALLCYTAHHAGIRQVILPDPMRAYHIEHSSGAGWTPEGEDELNARVARLKVPRLDFDSDVRGWVQRMRRFNAPAIFNLGDWGLESESLASVEP